MARLPALYLCQLAQLCLQGTSELPPNPRRPPCTHSMPHMAVHGCNIKVDTCLYIHNTGDRVLWDQCICRTCKEEQ